MDNSSDSLIRAYQERQEYIRMFEARERTDRNEMISGYGLATFGMFGCGIAQGLGHGSRSLELIIGGSAITLGIISAQNDPCEDGDITIQRPALMAIIGAFSYGVGYGLGKFAE